MKGTILEFLQLATEKPELAKKLVELAAEHDFEFTAEELSDQDLESVSGGGILADMMSSNEQYLALQSSIQMESRRYQSISNALRAAYDVQQSSIDNIKA